MKKTNKKSFMKRFSYMVNKGDIKMNLKVMYSSDSIAKLLCDLKSNRRKRIKKIGELLSAIFPEVIHFEFSEEAISGKCPMFYFFEDLEDKYYFLLKLADIIRNSYLVMKLTEDEIIQIDSLLDMLVEEMEVVDFNEELSSDVYNKALSYYLAYLSTTEKITVNKGSIKQTGPNRTLALGKFEEKDDFADTRELQFLLSHNGSRIESVSLPIVEGYLAFSYVFVFNVRDYKEGKIEIIFEISMRNWITEDEFSCRFSGNKSLYITSTQSNKLCRLEFSNKKVKVSSVLGKTNALFNKEGSEYSIGVAEQSIIEECCSHKNFWDILDNTRENVLDNARMFAGIPVSKDVIWQLTSSRIFDNLGTGIMDCKYFFEHFHKILGKHICIGESDGMELISNSALKVNSVSSDSGCLDVHKCSIDGDLSKGINVVYYCSDEEMLSGMLDMFDTIEMDKIKEKAFTLIENIGDKYIYKSRIGDKEYLLTLIVVKTTLFNDEIESFNSDSVDVTGMDREQAKEYKAKMKDKYFAGKVKEFRSKIKSVIREFGLDGKSVSNIVDMEDYHLRKTSGEDPYKHVKKAFMEEGQHVQVRNLKAFKNQVQKDKFVEKSKHILKSCLKDILTKQGVYVGFKNVEKAFKELDLIGVKDVIALGYVDLGKAKLLAAVKMDSHGLSMKIPEVMVSRDSLSYKGTGKWGSIADVFNKINLLKSEIAKFRGKTEVISAQSSECNKRFVEMIASRSDSMFLVRNVVYKQYVDILSKTKCTLWCDEVMVKHLIIDVKDDVEDFTAGCAVAKDTLLGNRYISTSTRPDTLKGAPKLASRYIMGNVDVRRARGFVFDVINIENTDIVGVLMHEMRKMSLSYDVSTKYPHPLYLLDILNNESKKAE